MEKRVLKEISILEERIGYTFKNKKLIERALTHRSFAAEHNERLEFLGDSVLNCVVGHALFLRDTHFTEGVLSRARANFVCEKTLDDIGRAIEIGSFIRMGEGELKSGGATRPSIMADACEAVFGAVFLDSGFEAAQGVILRLFEPILSASKMTADRLAKDSKTVLQELLQSLRYKTPDYVIENIVGKPNAQTFECSCSIPELSIKTTGTGTNRRSAEQLAAGEAIRQIEARGPIQPNKERGKKK